MTPYRKSSAITTKQSKGTKSLTVSHEISEIDFDEIDPSLIRDDPRQVIIKKKHFPRKLVAIVSSAKRIDFSKEKDKKGREEIVVNLECLFDLDNQNMIRIVDGQEVDYSGIEVRFHLPKRFQECWNDRFKFFD